MQSTRNTFLNSLIQAISTRFEGDLHLFKGCTVLSFPKWPRSLEQDIEFGDSHIVELVEVSRPALELSSVTVDPDATESEWTRFKTELYNTSSKSIQTMTWSAAADAYISTYPNLFMLIDYLLTLPSSSHESHKNDWRSRLGCQNLSDLILVSLETPSVDKYDPTSAINAWNTGGLEQEDPFTKMILKRYNFNTTVNNIVLIEEAEIPEFEMADEDQNDILIEPDHADVYMCAEKLENEDEEQDEDDELFENGTSCTYIVVVGDGQCFEHLIKLKSENGANLSWARPFPGDYHILKNLFPTFMKLYFDACPKQLTSKLNYGSTYRLFYRLN
ncbi:unnamed protein product [Mytilus coruscus]|uniref:Uncharacterized protein n=1 Tax=Mytilus coruscus TaxID=42192 RepID=A0A6J8DUY7_MYTCO|nr:unnamed protein product [Mytilus coruscus]